METKFEEQTPIDVSGIRIFAHNTILDIGVGYVSFARDLYILGDIINMLGTTQIVI